MRFQPQKEPLISLPILNCLDVTDYGLYPGDAQAQPGMHIEFRPGLTLVLGANGLGKTTLVNILYRALTGPYDIPALSSGKDLGTARLKATALRGQKRRVFADRVADNAAHASARLSFTLGGQQLTVERNLADLKLRFFTVDGSTPRHNETDYQTHIVKLANVPTFGDWILLLRYIVFYFEDRRSLVWDPTAQRQVLRLLFLDATKARYWTKQERDILRLDSRVRNMKSVINTEERTLAQDESRALKGHKLREELNNLKQTLDQAMESLEHLNYAISDIEHRHEKGRLRYLSLQQQRESLYRGLERLQLLAISSRLPQQSDSARYILTQLITESSCLACGTHVPGFVESMNSRIRDHHCVICGSVVPPSDEQDPIDLTNERIRRGVSQLEMVEQELTAAQAEFERSERERSEAVTEITRLEGLAARNRSRIESLARQLPPEEQELHKRRKDLASIRARMEVLRSDLTERRTDFVNILAEASVAVERDALRMQEVFHNYATEFLFEECRLVWSPKLDQLGQTGPRFDFPAFELELGGSDFVGTVRRSGPDVVSQSQMEFIDLSFRMALVLIATQERATSLIMDAPESSLDAVFEERAARILGSFGRPDGDNRLVLTLNLVSGDLIPALLAQCGSGDVWHERIVDLLSIAAPTAAVRSLPEDYERARARLLDPLPGKGSFG